MSEDLDDARSRSLRSTESVDLIDEILEDYKFTFQPEIRLKFKKRCSALQNLVAGYNWHSKKPTLDYSLTTKWSEGRKFYRKERFTPHSNVLLRCKWTMDLKLPDVEGHLGMEDTPAGEPDMDFGRMDFAITQLDLVLDLDRPDPRLALLRTVRRQTLGRGTHTDDLQPLSGTPGASGAWDADPWESGTRGSERNHATGAQPGTREARAPAVHIHGPGLAESVASVQASPLWSATQQLVEPTTPQPGLGAVRQWLQLSIVSPLQQLPATMQRLLETLPRQSKTVNEASTI